MTVQPILYGADYSVYVRIARMALIEKGVEHTLEPVDIFAEDGPPDWYANKHPFGRIPALSHGDFDLYETSAICRYVDETFEGPPLQPSEPAHRARMAQIIAMLDAYAYRPMVWDVAVERLERSPPDEALIVSGLKKADNALRALRALKADGPWLLGDRLTIADLHAGPIVGYFAKAPEGRAMLSNHPEIEGWWNRLAARDSYRKAQPAG